MNVRFYTTHCPKCDILSKKLHDKNIEYEEITDIDKMLSMGFTVVPILEVDGKIMNFKTANDWINKKIKEEI